MKTMPLPSPHEEWYCNGSEGRLWSQTVQIQFCCFLCRVASDNLLDLCASASSPITERS